MISIKDGKITVSKRNALLMLFVILLLYFAWNYQDIRLWFHSVTLEGEKYTSVQQISDDLNFVYQGKYKIDDVGEWTIDKDFINDLLEDDRRTLLRFSHSSGNKLLQISFTDVHTISGINLSYKEVLTREAVSILYFLSQRELMEDIKAVQFFYHPNFGPLAMVGGENIIIPLDEFEKELQENKGNSIEESLTKIQLSFY
ncbi:hypothetical protein [Bacillus sp. ISL-45]|uniref:hypothetical protein n=1 Tax=Bacillus sp. ISL-45 TaxID=2819128 RepID=UPI001BE72341|nr:hypothetical protein [Bacillus sp. ISL-45]MBT2663231.1 hypothetical protein [Bacillus sp. ISL-45]